MARVVQVGSDKVILDGYRVIIDAAHPIHDWSVREFCHHPIYFEGWKYLLVGKRRLPKPFAMRYELYAWPADLHEASTREFTYDEDFVAARDAQFAAEHRHTVLWCLLSPLYPFLGFFWSGFKERVLWPIGFVPSTISKVSLMFGFSFLLAETILYGWLGHGFLPLVTRWTFHWGIHDVPDAVLIVLLACDCVKRFDQMFLDHVPVPYGFWEWMFRRHT